MRGRSTSAQSAMQGGPLSQNLTIHKQLMVKPCSGEMEALVESAFSIHLPLLGQLEMPRLQPEPSARIRGWQGISSYTRPDGVHGNMQQSG